MTPEVLQEKFLDWQCQSRIQAFRTQNGRPNSSMAPILLDKKGNELLRIIVVISENGLDAGSAGVELQKMGIEEVYLLRNGLISWEEESLPLVK